ncbi:DUF1573 domain-containing protein [Sediminibacterium goheungense]|uniref:Uncharacterized protein DUF1573 n=1 Tax=Sediminibacterium goheungense TaxID=1086393 RepID=A0A4R6IZ32_9BACT|nr:DUF1573 domain-containing protein [Sediminibacterium goheungense]TDO28134.1 uncharacterized protein DUF1573 [Sediminibacterium goheungense]
MIRFLLHILLFISLGACTVENKKSPKVLVKEQVKNIGTISISDTTKVDFRIYNVGGAILKIDSVSASCECTVPNFVKRNIAPNDSADLTVSFAPLAGGDFEKAIVLKSNIDSVFTILKFRGTVKDENHNKNQH